MEKQEYYDGNRSMMMEKQEYDDGNSSMTMGIGV